MEDTAIATMMIERHVSALSGVSEELTVEDLQRWTTTYKEDKGDVAAYMKLRQGQKYEGVYLTPSDLMARRMGGWQKVIIPKSLQQILKECHDAPFIGHMGMRKTFELVDWQFHWRGL